MKKYIDSEKLIKSVNNYREGAKAALNPIDGDADYYKGKIDACKDIQEFITSLLQEQPDGLYFTPLNRLIQKIPSEKWNDSTNNYAKKLRDCLIKEGYRKDAEVLQCYISYMNGNNVPMATMDEKEQPEPSNNLVDIDAVREDFITEVYRVLDADPTNDRANAIIDAFDSLPTVSQEQPEVDLVAELKHHLATTPKEQLEKEWKELEHWGNIGPTVQDFLYGKQPEADLEKFTEKIKTFQGRYKHPEIVSIKGAMAFMARMFYQYPNVARRWYDNLPKATMD